MRFYKFLDTELGIFPLLLSTNLCGEYPTVVVHPAINNRENVIFTIFQIFMFNNIKVKCISSLEQMGSFVWELQKGQCEKLKF